MSRRLAVLLLALLIIIPAGLTRAQSDNADVAAYQLGVTAQALPGAALTYSITVTNYGPAAVTSFYVIDGWTVNAEGIAAFAQPISDPDFGQFKLAGSWEQNRKDQNIMAWLLDGELDAGDTVQFNWKVQVADKYQGGLVNWARILDSGTPDGSWQPHGDTAPLVPPTVANASDPDADNNRTPDGVTLITDAPDGQGVDMAIFQAGLLSQLKAAQPLDSTWLVTNLGPETVKQFYVEAGWSLGPDNKSLLVQPTPDPDFGDFKVVGRWQQVKEDEELWLWLVQGELPAANSVSITWERSVVPTYRGDLVNWTRVFAHDIPPGDWVMRQGTSQLPAVLDTPSDTDPKNDRSADAVSTVS